MLLTKRLNLRDREQVVAIVRRSVLAYLGSFLLAFAALFLAFFLVVPLFARGPFGQGAFIVLVVFSIGVSLRTIWFWYWTAFVVTNLRVIDVDQVGVLHRNIAEARLEKIEDIAVEIHGIIATVFHLGTIRIQTSSATARIEIRTVPRPELVHELLGRLHGEAVSALRPNGVEHIVDLSMYSAEDLARLRVRIEAEQERRMRQPEV